MRRLRALAAVVVLVAGGLAGCSGDDSGGGASTEKPAVCDSVGALKSATAGLQKMSVRSDGVAGIQDQLTKVQDAYADVKTDAADQFGSQLTRSTATCPRSRTACRRPSTSRASRR